MKTNPKTHDGLFKWLITSFTKEFFAHYFPGVKIGRHRFIDKEFISKYEALKESLKGDLFLVMEVEIDDRFHEVVIQIEHKSRREYAGEKVFEYTCYSWLLKRKPVWSIVIYTDDAVWRKPVSNSFLYAFDSENKNCFHHFDVIKVKAEKSADLTKKHSLLCKLLALKADDRDTDPEKLIIEIYQAAARMKDLLTNEQLLLIEQWVNVYKKIPDQAADRIRKEAKMDMMETTITEHIFNLGEIEGKRKGEIEGIRKGEIEGIRKGEIEGIRKGNIEGIRKGNIEGKIELLEKFFLDGVLSKKQFENVVAPLREQLKNLI